MIVIASIFLGVVPALFYAWFVYWLDRYEKEPLLLVGGVFLWGAIVAAGGAFILNTVFGLGIFLATGSEAASSVATGSVSAPLVEESLKGLAVLIVFLIFRHEFDNLLDGVVYAGVAALGFAATENSIYIYRGFAEGGVGGGIFLTFIRNIVVGWQHPFYTSFIGIGLAIARETRHQILKFAAPVAGWVLAVFTHALHNTTALFISSLGSLAAVALVEWTGWLFMLGLIAWFIYRERVFMQSYLKEEVELGTMTEQQYKTATFALSAFMARLRALSSGRFGPTHRFYQQAAELAHKKRQLHVLNEEKAEATISKLRAELAGLSANVMV
jgi:RsiW-degrading membrane proteinase PrsW (M82 family)